MTRSIFESRRRPKRRSILTPLGKWVAFVLSAAIPALIYAALRGR